MTKCGACTIACPPLLVLDAAYSEYVRRNDYEAGLELVATTENTVMTRTFSKIYGLAALRLGWAYCPAPIADVLNRVRGPFNVTAPAIAAGVAALEDKAHIETAVAHNEKWLPWVTAEFEKIGIKVTPSIGNFVLMHFPAKGKDAVSADEHLKARGIILRRVAAYGLPNCLRMTIGTEDDNRRVVAALAEFMGRIMTEPMFERVALIGLGLIGSSLSHAIGAAGLHAASPAMRNRRRPATPHCGWGWRSPSMRPQWRRRTAPIWSSCALPSACAGRWRRDGAAAASGRDPDRCRIGEGRGRARCRPASAGRCAFHPGASDRRHRAVRTRSGLCRAVRRALVHPDAARPAPSTRGRRQAGGVLDGAAAAKVEIMDAQHHDMVLAITSHLPHLIAYNIVKTARHLERVTDSEVIKFSAGGFRDFTRIAASDPMMWRDVFLNNKEAVLEMLGRFSEDLTALQRAIRFAEGETLHKLLRGGARDATRHHRGRAGHRGAGLRQAPPTSSGS